MSTKTARMTHQLLERMADGPPESLEYWVMMARHVVAQCRSIWRDCGSVDREPNDEKIIADLRAELDHEKYARKRLEAENARLRERTLDSPEKAASPAGSKSYKSYWRPIACPHGGCAWVCDTIKNETVPAGVAALLEIGELRGRPLDCLIYAALSDVCRKLWPEACQ
jgi:hypothetical protein